MNRRRVIVVATLTLLIALCAAIAYRAFDNWWNTEERLTALVNDRALIGLDIADAERLIGNTRSFIDGAGDRVYYFHTNGLSEVELTLAVGDTGVVYDATLRRR